MLQNEQAGDKPRRQARLPCLAHRTKAIVQDVPVDQRRQPHQRVTQVDDLIQRRKQQVFLAIIPRSAHRLPQSDDPPSGNHESLKSKIQDARKQGPTPCFPAKSNTISTPLLLIS